MAEKQRSRGFRYVARDGVVVQIGGTNTAGFLRIDRLPNTSDRTLTSEALEIVGHAREWAEELHEREKKGK